MSPREQFIKDLQSDPDYIKHVENSKVKWVTHWFDDGSIYYDYIYYGRVHAAEQTDRSMQQLLFVKYMLQLQPKK